MIVSSLSSYYYWSNRSVLIPGFTLDFLSKIARAGLPDVIWVDGESGGNFSVQEVVTRVYAVQYAGLWSLYVRQDMSEKEYTFFAYLDRDGNFVPTSVVEYTHCGQPCVNR